jgi:predicted Zn-dependent protease
LSFSYKPANAPAEFSPTLVAGMVAKAAAEWSKCGVSVDVLVWVDDTRREPGVVAVHWSGEASAGNFGLANLGKRTLSLSRSAFELLRTRNPTHDARETLQMVISHEMGHFFGLMAHSRRCVDVLSYYHDAKGEKCFSRDPSQVRAVTEYRHVLPTACDIERCRAANGMLPR